MVVALVVGRSRSNRDVVRPGNGILAEAHRMDSRVHHLP